MNATAQRLVIFARAPVHGQVKTRLAKDIGDIAALDFYQHCLDHLLTECAQGDWSTIIAVASNNDLAHPIFYSHSTTVQVNGDLGQRMQHELKQNHYHHCLIVGSDIPSLTAKHIEEAFTALDSHDLVFGPATDGGFWSVGCRRSLSLPSGIFKNVRWSTQFALKDSLQTIPTDLRVAESTPLSDVDDGESYQRLKPFKR